MLGARTLFVNPPLVGGIAFTRQGRCQEREEVLGTTKPPYTLALAAALFRERGWAVHLDDLTATGRSIDDLIAKLDASPSFHLGGTFGHALSTSNSGRLTARCGALVGAAFAGAGVAEGGGAGDGGVAGACADSVMTTVRMRNRSGKYLRTESSGIRPVGAL